MTVPMFFRRLAIVGIAASMLCLGGCREVSQPAFDGVEGPLYPVEQDGEWGYITRAGSLAIEPQYNEAGPFVDGRALVRQDEGYGFIDARGQVVIPTRFAAARSFSNGLAPVRPDSLWGFIDRDGTMVIPPQFALGRDTSNRVAPSQGPAGPLRLAPSAPAPPSYFSANRARVERNREWGYIDRDGNVAVPPQFTEARAFRNGLARVRFADGEMGYVTPSGTPVWPPRRSE